MFFSAHLSSPTRLGIVRHQLPLWLSLNPGQCSPEGSAESDEMDVLATLIEAFEGEHYPIDPPDPIEAIKFRLKQ
jgi:hypothetical protein